jgi:tRNA dimethylallyltransferase
MPSTEHGLSLVVLVGPTAVGKSELAIELALRLGGEIVSADSRQFYRGMDIGTAKPTPQEQRLVPHHLIDVADPDKAWSLATFQQAAREAIRAIHARHKLPLLVGGTGQYVRAVTHGWEIPPVAPSPLLRQALEAWAVELSPTGLHARLAVVDPVAAADIDPRNLRRTIRALEVIFSTGQPFSVQRQSGPSDYRLFLVGLSRPRPELYARIDARIDTMFAAGFIDEVRQLLALGYSPSLPTLSAIGYREVIAFLQGEISMEEAVTLMKRRTRDYVRRQASWFRLDDPQIHWFQAGPGVLEAIESEIKIWLNPLISANL